MIFVMKPICIFSLFALSALSGCNTFNKERFKNETEERMHQDSAARQARMHESGTLNDQEYKAVSDRMGWARPDARGLPPAPTTEELEKKVKAAEGSAP